MRLLADAGRFGIRSLEAQLRGRAHVASRRVPDGVADVCVGRAGGAPQYLQYE